MISQSESGPAPVSVFASAVRYPLQGSELFPEVVKRCYERAIILQTVFDDIIRESNLELPERSCICLSGSVSRLECVCDSDIDYVLIWDDLSFLKGEGNDIESREQRAVRTARTINRNLAKNSLRPCDSFSSAKPLSELISTENLFSRYSIISLVDSTPVLGSERGTYSSFLGVISKYLADYAIGISAENQVIRALNWYIQREGWMDQLHYGTSVNRFSRLIQLFTTILSVNTFGIEWTRETKTTWLRIQRLEPYLPEDVSDSLKKFWIMALELKENRQKAPMLTDSGFIGISQLLKIWNDVQSIIRPPIS